MTDVRHLLLQKGDGKFYALCTWLEIPKDKVIIHHRCGV